MSNDIRKTGLLAQADEAQAQEGARASVGRSNVMVNIGLALSALLSVLYITLALGPELAIGEPFNYALAVFVGFVSVIPAELAIYIWRARLQGDVNITGAQRAIAAVCMVLAGISSAVVTMSFFGWALAALFPAFWLDAQPVANLASILGAWLIFILGTIGYDATSVTTRQNLQMANAMQLIHTTRANLIRSAAMAIKKESDDIVTSMDASHMFATDAHTMIADLLGLDRDRSTAVGAIAAARQTIDQNPDDPEEQPTMTADELQAEIDAGTHAEPAPVRVTGEDAAHLAAIAEGMTARPKREPRPYTEEEQQRFNDGVTRMLKRMLGEENVMSSVDPTQRPHSNGRER